MFPETKDIPRESVHRLFEGGIFKGAIRDTRRSRSRATVLQNHLIVMGENSLTCHVETKIFVQNVDKSSV